MEKRRAYFRRRYQENRERILAQNKAWNLRNKDKIKAASDRYLAKMTSEQRRAIWLRRYWDDPKAARARQRLYHSKHKEKRCAHVREYNRKHPDGAKRRDQQRRARKNGASGSYTVVQWMWRVAYFGWRCIYCTIELSKETLTIEHMIPLTRGGTNWPANLAPACRSCNSTKYNKTIREFMCQ